VQFTLKQLAYFVAAGEAGGILRAAENVQVSQPSILSAITHLEDVFQVQLFIRHHARGMSLTTTGGQIMEPAQALLLAADHALVGEASIALDGLADERFILLDLPLGGTCLMSLFDNHKIKAKNDARTCHIELQRALVAQGCGYSLGSVRPIKQNSLDGSRLTYVPLSGFNPGVNARYRNARQYQKDDRGR